MQGIINPIEIIGGMSNRILQIQQRISNIQSQFADTENKLSVDSINADFQSKLDNEIERQEKVQAAKEDAAKEKLASNLPVNENEIINAAKVAAALSSGNVATPDILAPIIKRDAQSDLPPSMNDKDSKDRNFDQSSTEELILTAARRNGVSPDLVRAVAIAESDMNQNEISPVGAIGVMQLMPETAAALGVNPYDEAQNIEGGAMYLRKMLDKFDGNVSHALAAYNAGPGAVQKYGGVPPYRETQNYVGRIMDIVTGS